MKSFKPFAKEILSLIILGVLFVITFLITDYWDRLTNYLDDHPIVFWLIGGYFILFIGMIILKGKYPNRATNAVTLALTFPLAAIMAIGMGIMPMLRFVMNLIFFLSLCYMVPLLLVAGLSFFDIIEMTAETKTFIFLAGTSAIALVIPTQVLQVVYTIWGKVISRKGKESMAIKPTEYILNVKNIRLSLFVAYLFFLVPYSIHVIQGKNLLDSRSQDLAVLQSFIVLVALNGLIINTSGVSIYPSKLLEYIVKEYKKEWGDVLTDSDDQTSIQREK